MSMTAARIVTGRQISRALHLTPATLRNWKRAGWFPAPLNTAREAWRHYPVAYYDLDVVVEAVRGRFSEEFAEILRQDLTAGRKGA